MTAPLSGRSNRSPFRPGPAAAFRLAALALLGASLQTPLTAHEPLGPGQIAALVLTLGAVVLATRS